MKKKFMLLPILLVMLLAFNSVAFASNATIPFVDEHFHANELLSEEGLMCAICDIPMSPYQFWHYDIFGNKLFYILGYKCFSCGAEVY